MRWIKIGTATINLLQVVCIYVDSIGRVIIDTSSQQSDLVFNSDKPGAIALVAWADAGMPWISVSGYDMCMDISAWHKASAI